MTSPAKPFTGTHDIVDMIDCQCDFREAGFNRKFKTYILQVLAENDLCVLGNYFHDFAEPGALTAACVLSESHVTVHTWPEYRYVTMDVFICDYTRNNSAKVANVTRALTTFFQPDTIDSKTLKR